MTTSSGDQPIQSNLSIPLFGARKLARKLAAEVQELRAQRDAARNQLERLGAIPILQLETRRVELQRETAEQAARISRVWNEAAAGLEALKNRSWMLAVRSSRPTIWLCCKK